MNDAVPVLAARAAGRRFGGHIALEPTDLELHDGEAVALVGPNGAGKSTLLSLMAGALEPTAALDPEQRLRLWDRVTNLKETGGSLAFATQNLEEVERLADRVAVLRDGVLVFSGSAAEYDRSHTAMLLA